VSGEHSVNPGANVGAPRPKRALHRVQILLAVVALIALVSVVAHLGDGRAFLALAWNAKPAWLLLAVVLQAATYAALAAVWRSALTRKGESVPFWKLFRLALVALFTSQSVPSAGLAGTFVVIQAFRAWGVSEAAAMSAVLVDIIAYYVAYGVFVGLGVLFLTIHQDLSRAMLGLSITVVLVGAVLAGSALRLTTAHRPLPAPLRRWKALAKTVETLSAADPAVVRSAPLLLRTFLFRASNFALDAATLWVCLLAIGVRIGPGPVLAAFMMGSVVRTLGIVPGGIGTFEAATLAGLALFKVGVEPAFSAVLIFRGLSFWLPLPVGFVFSRRLLVKAKPA
jgi:uncharacterized membrane protein YbhN (UPF0104 family)